MKSKTPDFINPIVNLIQNGEIMLPLSGMRYDHHSCVAIKVANLPAGDP